MVDLREKPERGEAGAWLRRLRACCGQPRFIDHAERMCGVVIVTVISESSLPVVRTQLLPQSRGTFFSLPHCVRGAPPLTSHVYVFFLCFLWLPDV